jgi:hypothetical protein
MSASGPRAASRVAESPLPNFASSWSAEGGSIVSVRTTDTANRHDVWVQHLKDGRSERLPFNTSMNEWDGKVSPDGRWIAYTTDASGKDEVWLAAFPDGANRRKVSTAGGTLPEWGGSREILYIADDKQLMSCAFDGTTIGPPRPLFRIPNLLDIDKFLFPTAGSYVPASDGRRFLIAVSTPDPAAPPVQVIVNWPALLMEQGPR